MDEKYLQEVFSVLEGVLPHKWNNVAFYAGYTSGSYTMKYFVDCGHGYIDCFSLSEVKKPQILRAFLSIDKIISAERKAMEEKDRWNVIGLFVDSMGKVKCEFDYTDISENSIEYERGWKAKHNIR